MIEPATIAEADQRDVASDATLITALIGAIGENNVVGNEAERNLYSTDLSFRPREVATALIRPENVEQLSAAVKVCTGMGFSVVARGGGMSYTSGYTPTQAASVLVDLQSMNRIVEINQEDMFVTVEAGVTWKELYETLYPLGLRTPYFGPLSGMYATVGGAVSQNSLFHGSGVYNTVAESVLGLKVVLANGDVLQTGSSAHVNANGFYRHFGPDVTGLFTADTGAFGIKAVITLRLITTPKSTGYLSFKFDTLESMLAAQVRIARLRIASECYGFDPYYNSGFEDQGISFEEGLSVVGQIVRKGGIKGIKNAAKLALAGKKVLRNVPYSLHMTLDGHTDQVCAEHVDLAAEICQEEGGTEMANSIPVAFRNQPFGGVRTVLLGSDGAIWIPVHGFFPLSKAATAASATEKFLEERKALMEEWGIKTSYLTAFSGSEFVIEPSFYWLDELGEFRLSLIEDEFADKWKEIPANEERRRIALQLRDELRDLFDELGGVHLQIGKYYPYFQMMENRPLEDIIRGMKKVIDPENRINPGCLGL